MIHNKPSSPYPDWKDIPGYEGIYQASPDGRVRHLWPKGTITEVARITHPQRGRTVGTVYVRLTRHGVRREHHLSRIMADTFLGGVPSGMAVYHLDGVKGNNGLHNLRVMTRRELGRRTGPLCAGRIVLKLDAQGEIVACDLANRYSDAVTIVPITSRIKKPLPTHVRIGIDAGLYKPSTILCEKITTMKKRYLGHYIGSIRGTRVESELNAALHAALSLPHEGG